MNWFTVFAEAALEAAEVQQDNDMEGMAAIAFVLAVAVCAAVAAGIKGARDAWGF